MHQPTIRQSEPRPLAIDLFAGVGGMSLGLEQAGFDLAVAVEYDPIHAAVHERNFPLCKMMVRSAADIDAAAIRAAADLDGKHVALVVGGPPCQGFSSMGHKALDDPRNELVRHFLRLAIEIGPDCFVMENVRGLLASRNEPMLDAIRQMGESAGYRVEARVINARAHGVPQDRVRVVIIGTREGIDPLPPIPHRPLEISCAEAIGDLPDADDFPELLLGDAVRTELRRPSEYAADLRVLHARSWHHGHRRVWDPGLMTSAARTVHSQAAKEGFSTFVRGRLDERTRLHRLHPDGVSCTLRAGTDASRGSFTSARPVHYVFDRAITVREMARLHGFPDWFRLHVTKAHGARQVGNAVPPPLARAVGYAVLAALGKAPAPSTMPPLTMDDRLLDLDMTSACRHFGVPRPYGIRPRQERLVVVGT